MSLRLPSTDLMAGCLPSIMGGKLIAEYRPQENSYFYYATDQIGSTRIVTDDTGAVVYAAAHDPYGGIQQTWTAAYDPALKFSGKERDTESGLDYFGARYYDHSLYRFLSVDPMIPVGLAISDPQRWNLYSYCGNQPLTHVDSTGLYHKEYHKEVTYDLAKKAGYTGSQAMIIAQACYNVDVGSTSSYVRLDLHFPDPGLLARIRMQTLNAQSLEELGFYLHIIQDSYAHSGTCKVWIPMPNGGLIVLEVPVNQYTHWWLTTMWKRGLGEDPDDPERDPDRTEQMKKETFYALLFWRAHHIRFHNDVIFQVPCL